jgi:hypothetical protein
MGTIKTLNETKTFSILQLRPLDEGEDWSAQGGRRFQRLFMPKAATSTRVLTPVDLGAFHGSALSILTCRTRETW